MSLMRKLAGLAALALAGTGGSAAAQEIVLYDMQGYGGQSVRITGDTRNLTSMRFNDRASSLRIVSGTWEICVHENYGGECIIYNNDERDLGRFSNQFTSLRPAAPGLEGGRGGRRGSLTLYSGPNYTGRSVTLDHEEPNFARIGFNDLARSARYDGRRSWRVCQHANFDGACMEVDGDIPSIGGGMAAQISSVEPDYGSRPGRPGWGRPGRPGRRPAGRGAVPGGGGVAFANGPSEFRADRSPGSHLHWSGSAL